MIWPKIRGEKEIKIDPIFSSIANLADPLVILISFSP